MEIICPQCKSGSVVEGKIFNQADYIEPRACFRPNGLPFFASLVTNIWIKNKFFACSVCGFIWAKDNEKDVRESLSRIATRYVQKKSESKPDEVYELGK
ncbi:MAG: hypothetical protein M0R48_06060 [Candidatus Omnitrophica bacterium]|jgi:hypothetical protein|nr:hypothetical protein [Candidatus Omnitrophota bacterium]